MPFVLALLGSLRAALRTRTDLAFENLELRQQLALLRRGSRLAPGLRGCVLRGVVEIDETYVGGKPRRGTGKHKAGRGTKKIPVVALVERGGRMRSKVIASIVIDSTDRLRDGAKVTVAPAEPAAPAAENPPQPQDQQQRQGTGRRRNAQ